MKRRRNEEDDGQHRGSYHHGHASVGAHPSSMRRISARDESDVERHRHPSSSDDRYQSRNLGRDHSSSDGAGRRHAYYRRDERADRPRHEEYAHSRRDESHHQQRSRREDIDRRYDEREDDRRRPRSSYASLPHDQRHDRHRDRCDEEEDDRYGQRRSREPWSERAEHAEGSPSSRLPPSTASAPARGFEVSSTSSTSSSSASIEELMQGWRERQESECQRHEGDECSCGKDMRLHAYRVVVHRVMPSSDDDTKAQGVLADRTEPSDATILVSEGQEYTFDGFMFLTHNPLVDGLIAHGDRERPLVVHEITDSLGVRQETHVWLEKDDEFDVDQLVLNCGAGGLEALSWFQKFFFIKVLQFDKFINSTAIRPLPQSRTSTSTSTSQSTTQCDLLNVFPRFLRQPSVPEEPIASRFLSAVRVRKCLLSSRINALKLIRQLTQSGGNDRIKASFVNHILLSYDDGAYRVDDVEFRPFLGERIKLSTPDRHVTNLREYWKKRLGASLNEDQPCIIHRPTYTSSACTVNVPLDSKTRKQLAHHRITSKKKIKGWIPVSCPASAVIPDGGFDLHHQRWQRIPIELCNSTAIPLVPELCDWLPLTAEMCQLGTIIPAVIYHIRQMSALLSFEKILPRPFSNKNLLRRAVTHPSFACFINGYGFRQIVNTIASCVGIPVVHRHDPDGGRTSNSGTKLPDAAPEQHVKEGILSSIMCFSLDDYQLLEYIGDSVVWFITGTRLFNLLPDSREGALTDYRLELISNDFLAHLARTIHLDSCIYTANISTTPAELAKAQHNMVADVFEALIGAIYLDMGINAVIEFFGSCLFSPHEADLRELWQRPVTHSFQKCPSDRHMIETNDVMKRFVDLEDQLGIRFKHIRLLIQAFTHRSIVTVEDTFDVGCNERLEYLGDAVLKLVITRLLWDTFPNESEKVFTRYSALAVSNRELAQVAAELGFGPYLRYVRIHTLYTESMLADCIEAFIGALYIDKGMEAVTAFVRVTILPRMLEGIKQKKHIPLLSRLRELLGPKSRISYKVDKETGPMHERKVHVVVMDGGRVIGGGWGTKRKEAEEAATRMAIESLQKNPSRSSSLK